MFQYHQVWNLIGYNHDYVSHMISPALRTGTSTIIDANVSSSSYHSGLDPNGQATYSGSETVAVVHTERYDSIPHRPHHR
jgi:hypothetical protein